MLNREAGRALTFPSLTASEELEIVRESNSGILDAERVVFYARNPETALHSKFQWDDTKAAEAYRLSQARQIIRLEVTVVKAEPGGKINFLPKIQPDNHGSLHRKYVSLSHDRGVDGGYRLLSDVVANPAMRHQLLTDAKRDMQIFRKKYGSLDALSGIFSEMDKVNLT
jgi:hypothetical protein